MTVCSNIKSYTRHHERIANLFSPLAVILFFVSIWFDISFQQQIIEWMGINIILNGSLTILVLAHDVPFNFYISSSRIYRGGGERLLRHFLGSIATGVIPGFCLQKAGSTT